MTQPAGANPGVLPVDDLISEVAASIGRAQAAMDAQAIWASQRLLADGLTQRFGLQARWYAIPEADFELKLLLQISESNELLAHVASADQQARYELDMESASEFHLKVRRLPPTEMGTPSLLSEKQVIELVTQIQKVAWFLHIHGGSFLSVSFSPEAQSGGYAGGTWSVELCRPTTPGSPGPSVIVAALFIVDDEAGRVVAAKFFEDGALPAAGAS